jgi:putative tricarboxylic transport membrane protein
MVERIKGGDMDLLSSVINGFQVALEPTNLFFCFIGCLFGTLIGVLPGLGPLAAIAFLLPVTYYVPVVPALIMLAGIYYGAMYGGSTTSILVNIPGEAASVVTCLDGYAMAQQGRAGPALGIAAIGSFVAGTFGIFILMILAPPLARFSLRFGPPEYATLLFLALVVIATISSGDQVKGFLMLAVGAALGLIGSDPISGNARFALGIYELHDGVGIAPLAIGLFGVSEVFQNAEIILRQEVIKTSFKDMLPSWKDYKDSWAAIVRGSFLGFFIGILPGGNPIVASFLSYGLEKKVSKHPERFGQGAIEGVAGPESANNSATSGAFIPLLSMGVPNNAVMALMLGAMMIHGVVPGPQLIDKAPQLFWGVIISMYIGNAMLLALNLPLIGLWVQLLRVPYRLLFPVILMFCLVGVYAINYSRFEMLLVIIFGTAGYLLRKVNFEMAPLIMGAIIGPMIETAIRQSLMLSQGSFTIFMSRPIPLFFLFLAVLVLVHPLIRKNVSKSTQA